MVIDALEMGLLQGRPPIGPIIFHRDRGSQMPVMTFAWCSINRARSHL